MLVWSENMRNVGNQFHLVPDEWVCSIFPGRDRSAQAAQHHRAHFQRHLAKVGDLNVRLERTHPACLILADDKLQVVAARSEYEAGVVLHRSEEHTSELQSLTNLVCRLLLEKKKHKNTTRKLV